MIWRFGTFPWSGVFLLVACLGVLGLCFLGSLDSEYPRLVAWSKGALLIGFMGALWGPEPRRSTESNRRLMKVVGIGGLAICPIACFCAVVDVISIGVTWGNVLVGFFAIYGLVMSVNTLRSVRKGALETS